jgi:hypothetical protein
VVISDRPAVGNFVIDIINEAKSAIITFNSSSGTCPLFALERH